MFTFPLYSLTFDVDKWFHNMDLFIMEYARDGRIKKSKPRNAIAQLNIVMFCKLFWIDYRNGNSGIRHCTVNDKRKREKN